MSSRALYCRLRAIALLSESRLPDGYGAVVSPTWFRQYNKVALIESYLLSMEQKVVRYP
jgi:hypothetical protein